MGCARTWTAALPCVELPETKICANGRPGMGGTQSAGVQSGFESRQSGENDEFEIGA